MDVYMEHQHSQHSLPDIMEERSLMMDEDRPVVLITTVDIGGGKSDKIELRKGDDPAAAARAFCTLHDLPEAIIGPLTSHVCDNLRKAKLSLDAVKVRLWGGWGAMRGSMMKGLMHVFGPQVMMAW